VLLEEAFMPRAVRGLSVGWALFADVASGVMALIADIGTVELVLCLCCDIKLIVEAEVVID